MSQPSKTQLLDIPLNQGLRQDLEPVTMVNGALVKANDVEFDKFARLQKRGGFSNIPTSLTVGKTAAYQGPGERFAEGVQGERIVFTDEGMHCYIPSKEGMVEAGPSGVVSTLRASLLEKFAIGADQTGQFVSSDCCVCGPWLIIVYTQENPLATSGTGYAAFVDVLDKTTRARALQGHVYVTNASATMPVRCISMEEINGEQSVFIFGVDGGGGINVQKILLTGETVINPFSVTSISGSDTDEDYPIYDASPTLGGYVVAFRRKSEFDTLYAEVRSYNLDGDLVNLYGWLSYFPEDWWEPTAITILGQRTATEKIIAAAWGLITSGGPSVEQVTFTNLGLDGPVKSYTPSSAIDGHDGYSMNQITLGRISSTKVAVMMSPGAVYLDPDPSFGFGTSGPRGPVYLATLTDAGFWANITPAFGNYCIASRFLQDEAGNLHAWLRFNVNDQSQSHYLLVDFCGTDNQVFRRPFPSLHVANGLVETFPVVDGLANGPIPIHGFTDLGDGRWLFAAPLNLAASALLGQQVGCWVGEFLVS